MVQIRRAPVPPPPCLKTSWSSPGHDRSSPDRAPARMLPRVPRQLRHGAFGIAGDDQVRDTGKAVHHLLHDRHALRAVPGPRKRDAQRRFLCDGATGPCPSAAPCWPPRVPAPPALFQQPLQRPADKVRCPCARPKAPGARSARPGSAKPACCCRHSASVPGQLCGCWAISSAVCSAPSPAPRQSQQSTQPIHTALHHQKPPTVEDCITLGATNRNKMKANDETNR